MKIVFVNGRWQHVTSHAILGFGLVLVCNFAGTAPPIAAEARHAISIAVVDFGAIKEEFDKIVVQIHGPEGMETLVASIGETEYAKRAARKNIETMAYQYFVGAVAKNAREQKIDLVMNSFDPECSSANPEILFKPKMTPGYVLFHSDHVDITEEVRGLFRESITTYLKEIITE